MATAEPADREGGSNSNTNSNDSNKISTGGKPMLARHRAKEEASSGNNTQGAGGAGASKGGYFPLSYRDGFSQWWASLSPAQTEHKVLSYVPYLQKPPTHAQSGTEAVDSSSSGSGDGSGTLKVDTDGRKEAAPVRTSGLDDPYGPRQWHSKLVQLAGKNRFLNEFSVERVGEQQQQSQQQSQQSGESGVERNSLVMIHGYGAGLGFFYKNFEALSRLPNWSLYALDLLGMGRSSRPPFRIHAKEKEAKVREAENWFIDALEEWRIKRGIDKMTLLGHSLGGYMAVCYALKYPGHLNKLILASPVGIPEDPYAVSEELPEPGDSTIANEFTQTQEETTNEDSASASSATSSKSLSTKTKQSQQKNKPPPRKLPKWVVALWDANVSPFSLVRLSGPLGPRLVSGWTSRRFSHLPPEEAQALHDYSYSLFRQRGSGEYALAYILAPGAFARSPLLRRIQGVGRQYLDLPPQSRQESKSHGTVNGGSDASAMKKVREAGIPVVFMYGSNDWMDVQGGMASQEILEAERAKILRDATPEERERDNGSAKLKVIQNAGHHLYLDGAEEFNRFILDEMRDVEARQARLRKLGA